MEGHYGMVFSVIKRIYGIHVSRLPIVTAVSVSVVLSPLWTLHRYYRFHLR